MSPEVTTFTYVCPLQDQQGKLRVNAVSTVENGRPFIQLSLSAVSNRLDRSDGDVSDWLNQAHSQIIQGFVATTTDAAKKAWRGQ